MPSVGTDVVRPRARTNWGKHSKSTVRSLPTRHTPLAAHVSCPLTPATRVPVTSQHLSTLPHGSQEVCDSISITPRRLASHESREQTAMCTKTGYSPA